MRGPVTNILDHVCEIGGPGFNAVGTLFIRLSDAARVDGMDFKVLGENWRREAVISVVHTEPRDEHDRLTTPRAFDKDAP